MLLRVKRTILKSEDKPVFCITTHSRPTDTKVLQIASPKFSSIILNCLTKCGSLVLKNTCRLQSCTQSFLINSPFLPCSNPYLSLSEQLQHSCSDNASATGVSSLAYNILYFYQMFFKCIDFLHTCWKTMPPPQLLKNNGPNHQGRYHDLKFNIPQSLA